MKRNQKGFGAVEVLLLLILLSIVGFTGYYVYHTKNNTDSTLNSTSQESASAAATPSASSTKFVFKEIGVQFDSPSDLKGLGYSIQHYPDGDSLYLTLPAFTAVNEKCYGQSIDTNTAPGPSFAAIGKVSGQFDASQAVETGLLKQFPDFYIDISYPNGITACTAHGVDGQYIFTQAHAFQNSFKTAFSKTATIVQ